CTGRSGRSACSGCTGSPGRGRRSASGRDGWSPGSGVPPFGHRTATRVLADRSLLDHDTVWAAAGTPHTVFPMDPRTLITHAGGTLVDVRERPA
ncbi:YbaK/EbsC family protein, partial [Streptomyces sp. NPDC003857]